MMKGSEERVDPQWGQDLKIPADAVEYVLLQRTDLQKWNVASLNRVIPYEKGILHLERRFRSASIAEGYRRSIMRDYLELAPHLPAGPRAIMDIGCGIALIDAALYHHFADAAAPVFHLVDKTEKRTVYYGFEETGAFYNSLDAAVRTCRLNGVPADRIRPMESGPTALGPPGSIDLLISLISWGFHYPVHTYLDRVRNVLSRSGTAILDVRKNTGGETILTHAFQEHRTISEDPVKVRLLLRSPIIE